MKTIVHKIGIVDGLPPILISSFEAEIDDVFHQGWREEFANFQDAVKVFYFSDLPDSYLMYDPTTSLLSYVKDGNVII